MRGGFPNGAGAMERLRRAVLVAFGMAAFGVSLGSPAAEAADEVLSESHYQTTLSLTCASSLCRGEPPPVAKRRRLNIRWISCQLNSSSGASLLSGTVTVRSQSTAEQTQFIGSSIHSASGVHIINQEMDVMVPERHTFNILLQVIGGSAGQATCGLNGSLQKVD